MDHPWRAGTLFPSLSENPGECRRVRRGCPPVDLPARQRGWGTRAVAFSVVCCVLANQLGKSVLLVRTTASERVVEVPANTKPRDSSRHSPDGCVGGRWGTLCCRCGQLRAAPALTRSYLRRLRDIATPTPTAGTVLEIYKVTVSVRNRADQARVDRMSSSERPPPQPSLLPLRILLAEDNWVNLKLAMIMLKRLWDIEPTACLMVRRRWMLSRSKTTMSS